MYRLIHIVMGDDLREAGFGILMNDEMLLNITNMWVLLLRKVMRATMP